MSLQTLIDAREDLNIRAYEVWSGWQQEHALAELEREAVSLTDALSPFESPREWPAFWILTAAFCIGGLVGLRFWP